MISTALFGEIFRMTPSPTLILKVDSPHFTIMGANLAYKEVTNLQDEDVIGQGIFDVFPDNPNDPDYTDGTKFLRESFERVLKTKEKDIIPLLKYDIPIRGTDEFEVRYWQPKNIPVLNDLGEVEYILHVAIDVTQSTISELELQASETKYKELVQSMNAIIWEADAKTFQYTFISPQAKNILGYEIDTWYENGFWEDHVHPEDKDRVLSYSLSMIGELKDHINEYRMIALDGSVVWISDVVSVTVTDIGGFVLRGVMTDITAKKIAEQAALANQSKISKILEHSQDIICMVNAEGIFLEVSPACENILGYKPDEMLGLPFLHFVHPDDASVSWEEAMHIIEGEATTTFENRYIHKNGDIVNMLWSCKWDEVNQSMYCVGKDGTYKKKIELQLQYSEQRFKSLVHYGADFIAILDTEGNFTYAGLNSEAILGYEAKALVGISAFSLVHQDDLPRVYALFMKLIEGSNIISDTFRYKNGDGKYQWMETIAIDMRDNPAVGGIVVNSRDVSEKKHYLEWHEYVNKATNNAIYDWDILEDKVQWGGYVEDIFSASDLKDTNSNIWVTKLHPDYKDKILQNLNDTLYNSKENRWSVEYKLANAEGVYLDIVEEGFFIRNNAGEAIRMIGALRDITDRKRFETEIQTSHQRYAMVTQATSDAIWDWDLITNSLYWGEGFQKLFGHNPGDLHKDIRSWNKLIHPKDYKRITDEIQQTIETDTSTWEGEYRFLNSRGDYVYVYDRGFVQRDKDGRAIRMVGAMQDIHTEKMKEVEDGIKLAISKIFTQEPTLESSFKKTIKAILQKSEFSYGEIWLSDVDRKSIALTAHYGKGTYTIEKDYLQLEWNKGFGGYIFNNKQDLFIEDIQDSTLFLRKNFARENGFQSVWGYPILFNEQVTAVVLLYYKMDRKKSNYSPLGSDILNLLGSEIQRKKAELELKFFFDLSPDFLCIVGMDGSFIKVNQKFEREIGPIFKNGIPLTYHEYSHPDDQGKIDTAMESLMQGKVTYNESQYRTQTGEYIWVGWDTAALLEQGFLFTIGKDITARKNQEKELEKSNALLTETLESIQDGFFTLDFDWKVTYWNNEAERILYAKREDVLGKSLWESFPEGLKLKFFKEYNRAMTHREIINFEEYFPPLAKWFNVTAFPSDNGITVYFKDITQTKTESLNLLQFKNVYENSLDEIAIISTVNDDIYLNPAYTDSLGYNVDNIKQLGGPQKAFASEDIAAEVFSSLLAGQHWKGDVELITIERNLLSYHISGGPVFDDEGKLIAVFLIHTNISQRKEIEDKLKDLYADLKLQTKALAESHQELEQFAHVASNDLQAPLLGINESLHRLQQEFLKDQGQPYIQEALQKSARLQFLINGLLEYTLMGRDKGEVEKVDLNEVIGNINKELREQIIDKFAIIDVPTMPVIKGHRAHLEQIFKNLITNSLTYNDGRPRIIIDFDSSKTHWLFSVSDNGTGFDPSYVEKIFHLFQTLDGRHNPEAKGMGLAITKKLVEKYKGNIWAETEPNVGSTFHFTISKDL